MTKKIFRSILIVAMLVFVACFGIITAVMALLFPYLV